MSEPQLPVVRPSVLLCPSCGDMLLYMNIPKPPSFKVAVTCRHCDRDWEFTLPAFLAAVEILGPGR